MPSIDVHVAAGLLDADSEQKLAEELGKAALRAEGLEPTEFLAGKSWVFFHHYPAADVLTGNGTPAGKVVRVQILTPHGRLGAPARAGLIREVTEIVARVVGDPAQAERTFVLLGETSEGGWGLAGLTGGALVDWAIGQTTAGSAGPAGIMNR
jgi:phenylpyruvate tautomerase PptA (4-oxalocrotonate tautomerase family)